MDKTATTYSKKNVNNITAIGLYNAQVRKNISNISISPIVQQAIKIFKDNAQNNKLRDELYNVDVENFNKRNGLVLLKRGLEYENYFKHYNYINYPYLNRESIKKTINNYRLFIHNYNKEIELENDKIREYNCTKVELDHCLTKEQKNKKALFIKENKKLFSKEYNTLVEKFNASDPIIPKRRILKITYQSELIFSRLVCFYASQLKKRNAFLKEMNKSTIVYKNDLPKLKINHHNLAKHKIGGIERLDVCKRTIKNHIKRFREAGVLINYILTNQNKPIKVNFSPKILVLLDGFPPKRKSTDNQYFKSDRLQTSHDNNDLVNSIIIKKDKIKDYAKGIDLKISYSTTKNNVNENLMSCGQLQEHQANKQLDFNYLSKKITQPQNLTKERPAKSHKIEVLTNNFLNREESVESMSKKLSNGVFFNYKGLRYDYLQHVSLYADITIEEFKIIIIQDFIKTSSKIWKNHNVYTGEWLKTIGLLYDQLFVNIKNKETLIEKLKEYRWKLNFARKWFIKTKINALFPYSYFDKNRKNSNEIGFYGLHKLWLKHKKYEQKKIKEQKELLHQGNQRKRRLSYQKKLSDAIKRYEKGKIDYMQLYDYVQDNLPVQYLVSLPNLIQKTTNLN